MPKTPRPHKFQLCLSDYELSVAEAMALREKLTKSELFRLKTIYRQLPRHVTRVAASTYWLLSTEADSLNQIAMALNDANNDGRIPKSGTLRELQTALANNIELLTQVRKELVDLDLLTQLSDSEQEDDDDWQANQG